MTLVVPGMPPAAIVAYGGVIAPPGWLACDGASYLRADYPELFAIVGTTFGSVDGTHFNVPDARNRFLIGSGSFAALGASGGSTDHNHTGPSHAHTSAAHTHTGPSHTHTSAGHTHTNPTHLHTGPNHTHASASHTHQITAAGAIGGQASSGGSGGTGFSAGAVLHRHTWPIANQTTDATAPNDTGLSGVLDTSSNSVTTDSTTPGATGASGTGDSGSTTPGDTGAAGTGATSTNNPPYLGVGYIIKT